jgi:hypothetical protein
VDITVVVLAATLKELLEDNEDDDEDEDDEEVDDELDELDGRGTSEETEATLYACAQASSETPSWQHRVLPSDDIAQK